MFAPYSLALGWKIKVGYTSAMKKSYTIALFVVLFPILCFAQSDSADQVNQAEEEIFKAQVLEILEEQTTVHDDGSSTVQQKVKQEKSE